MAASTRPIRTAYRPSFSPPIGNVECSTFAYLTVPRYHAKKNGGHQSEQKHGQFRKPNLVTTCGSTLTIFSFANSKGSEIIYNDEPKGKHTDFQLQIVTRISLAGNVVSLHTLPVEGPSTTRSASSDHFDELLIGFAGHPRLSIVHLECAPSHRTGHLLETSSIMDLTSIVAQESIGAIQPLEEDLAVAVKTPPIHRVLSSNQASGDHDSSMTGAAIVGGGVSVVVFDISRGVPENVPDERVLNDVEYDQSDQKRKEIEEGITVDREDRKQQPWCYTSESQYVLPLRSLCGQFFPVSVDKIVEPKSKKFGNKGSNKDVIGSTTLSKIDPPCVNVSTGWGEILQVVFLEEYNTPTLAILHGFRVSAGRMAGGSIQLASGNGDGLSSGHTSTAGATQAGTIASTTEQRTWHLAITTVSVSVTQRRSVVLWHCSTIPADTAQIAPMGGGILCVSPNVVCYVTSRGKLRAALAVNGFGHVACPMEVLRILQPNPSPLPRLSIQLDGCRLHILDANRAMVILNNGRVYGLQNHAGCTVDGVEREGGMLAIAPSEYRILHGAKSLSALPLVHHFHQEDGTLDDNKSSPGSDTPKDDLPFEYGAGYLFVGSNLGGNAQFLSYGFKALPLDYPDAEQERARQLQMISLRAGGGLDVLTGSRPDLHQRLMSPLLRLGSKRSVEEMGKDSFTDDVKVENIQTTSSTKVSPEVVSEDEMDMEEAELYFGFTPDVTRILSSVSSVVPYPLISGAGRKCLPNLSSYSFQMIDELFALGPLGAGCTGVAYTDKNDQTHTNASSSLLSPSLTLEAAASDSSGASLPFRDHSMPIYPYGHGKTGGIAILQSGFGAGISCASTVIRQEADVANVSGAFSLSKTGFIVLSLRQPSGGAIVLKVKQHEKEKNGAFSNISLEEVELGAWCNHDGKATQLWKHQILAAFEVGAFFIIMSQCKGQDSQLAMFEKCDNGLSCNFVKTHNLMKAYGTLSSISICEVPSGALSVLSCLWQDGHGSIVTITSALDILETSSMSIFEVKQELHDGEVIVAMDVFLADEAIFKDRRAATNPMETQMASRLDEENVVFEDEDDYLLYHGYIDKHKAEPPLATGGAKVSEEEHVVSVHIGVCRLSGLFQIFQLESFGREPVWQCLGAGSGHRVLSSMKESIAQGGFEKLREMEDGDSNRHIVDEFRFFYLGGPHETAESLASSGPIDETPTGQLHIAFLTEKGDIHLYEARSLSNGPQFHKASLGGMTTRSSNEQKQYLSRSKHRFMSSGKEKPDDEDKGALFRYNSLISFAGIAGRSGLFAAIAKPLWILAERGATYYIPHRMRHLAVGTVKPLNAWCPINTENAFLAVHERIGRAGSQKLTMYCGSSAFGSNATHYTGGGYGVTKLQLGVTVRKIIFLADMAVSSLARPLYIFLVARELGDDQNHLNDDGLTPEERKRLKEEKEAERTRRQVEADLGGFDMEQEWVEEIERDDYFDVRIHLGGAPPSQKEKHEVWLVDGRDWQVLDKHVLEEDEHGLTAVMATLTEMTEDTNDGKQSRDNEVRPTANFVAVGTGIVDRDGEDVVSKGKVLLFHVISSPDGNDPPPSLSLAYQKDILLGPVNSLSTLFAEGTFRLVIGAGAEVAIEQWGVGKLTQVGFFHAHMYVLDIKIFKNFFLLSDAYDSLYFLVWRESDKSLTLLAKDYEPTTIYCTGLISRGAALAFACHDERQNMQIYQYAPKDDASRGGNKLVKRADFHLGTQIISIDSHWCRSSLISATATPNSSVAALHQQDPLLKQNDDTNRFALHFGTIDGGLASIVPVAEPIYWRLAALRSVLANAVESHAALSPRSWRLYRRSSARGGCIENERKKSVVDGEVVLQYLDLPVSQQEELASAIGTTSDLIIDNILELEAGSIPC